MQTYIAHAAAALAAKGGEATVVAEAPRRAGPPPRDVHDGYTVERHGLPLGEVFDVPSPAAARAAWRSGRFDVIWVHSYHTPLAWLAVERAKAPVVLTPYYHGGGPAPLFNRPPHTASRAVHAAHRNTDGEPAPRNPRVGQGVSRG